MLLARALFVRRWRFMCHYVSGALSAWYMALHYSIICILSAVAKTGLPHHDKEGFAPSFLNLL